MLAPGQRRCGVKIDIEMKGALEDYTCPVNIYINTYGHMPTWDDAAHADAREDTRTAREEKEKGLLSSTELVLLFGACQSTPKQPHTVAK